MKNLNIPKKSDWEGYKNDLDLKEMYDMFNGKSIDITYKYFSNGLSISRSDELLYSNRSVFQYYIYAYVLYLLSPLGNDDDEAKEFFLNLLLNREEKDSDSVSQIFDKVEYIYYIDDEFNKHYFYISIEQVVDTINKQHQNFEIDNWLYEDIPELLSKVFEKFTE